MHAGKRRLFIKTSILATLGLSVFASGCASEPARPLSVGGIFSAVVAREPASEAEKDVHEMMEPLHWQGGPGFPRSGLPRRTLEQVAAQRNLFHVFNRNYEAQRQATDGNAWDAFL